MRIFKLTTGDKGAGLSATIVFRKGESFEYIQELMNEIYIGGEQVVYAEELTEIEDRGVEIASAVERTIIALFPDMSNREAEMHALEAAKTVVAQLCEHQWNRLSSLCMKCGIESDVGCVHEPDLRDDGEGSEEIACKKCHYVKEKRTVKARRA